MQNSKYPYKTIGNYLKHVRENLSESVAEVSGAVEIDIQMLNHIESGEMLPSEEILILLISHFDMEESEAHKVLKLAGYSHDQKTSDEQAEELGKQIFALMPFDSRVQYSDKTEILVNEDGLTISFMQQNMSGQYVPAARVGLSKTHAEKLVGLLEHALHPSLPQPKLLAQPKITKQSSKPSR